MMRQCPYILLPLFLLCTVVPAGAVDVSLAWDRSDTPDVSKYRIYMGSSFRPYADPVEVGNRTSHTVTNLSPGTYHFSVSAVDSKGVESAFSNEVSLMISGGKVVPLNNGLSGTSPESSQVRVPGRRTRWSLRAEVAPEQPPQSEEATHQRTRFGPSDARQPDNPGNGSGEGQTGPSDTTAPEIGNVSASRISGTSVTITWTTDEPADSQVEIITMRSRWRTAENAGSGGELDSAMKRDHSRVLTGLNPGTTYSYRVKSRDAAGNLSVSEGHSVTTEEESFVLAAPRFGVGAEVITGLSLVNRGSAPAEVSIKKIDAAGNTVSGPSTLNLGPGAQSPVIEADSSGEGWIRIESSSADVAGSFLSFDAAPVYMAGTRLGTEPRSQVAFTGRATSISVVNPDREDAVLTIDLVGADGRERGTQSRTVKAGGSLVADVYGTLFKVDPARGDYVRVRSSKNVHSFAAMKSGKGDFALLSGQDLGEGKTGLISAQYFMDDAWKTTLSVVNLDSRPGSVKFRFVGDDGVQIGEIRTVSVAGKGKIEITDPGFFLTLGPGETASGYVQVWSDGIRIAGSSEFGDRNGATFAAALKMQEPQNGPVLLSQVSSSDSYFTGVAVVNPNGSAASVSIELRGSDGILIASKQETIGAGNRLSRMLTEYFPEIAGRNYNSGYVQVISDKPVAAYSLTGKQDMSVLSALQ